MKKLILILLLCTTAIYSQWQLRSSGLPVENNVGWVIDAIDQNNAAVGGRLGLYITDDAGITWSRKYLESIYDFSMVSGSIIYAVTDAKIIKTTDGGTTWETIFQRASNIGSLSYIKAFQNTIIAMASCDMNDPNSPAQFYKSTDAGVSWNQVNQNYLLGCWASDLWRHINFGSSQTGLFFASGISPQKTFKTTDGGATWNDVGLSTYMDVIKMYDQFYGVAVGNTQTSYAVFVTTDGGSTWQEYSGTVTGSGRAIAIIPNHPAEVFISTFDGLFYSSDSGQNWTRQNLNIFSRVEDIVFVNESVGWILGFNGQVYWTDNKGNPVVGVEKDNQLPTQFALEQNYPNPFNPSTKIKFSLPEAGRVAIKVYDILGRDIKTLIDNEKSAGNHTVDWSGDNYTGEKVSAGIYMYSIITNKFMQTKKMILLK